jgi:hypothetical protein
LEDAMPNPTERAYPDTLNVILPEPYLIAIGKVTVVWGTLESIVDLAIQKFGGFAFRAASSRAFLRRERETPSASHGLCAGLRGLSHAPGASAQSEAGFCATFILCHWRCLSGRIVTLVATPKVIRFIKNSSLLP